MNIFGKKISLKAIQREDLRFLMELHNDPVSGATIGGWDPPVSYHQQEKWFDGLGNSLQQLRYAIWRNEPEAIVGQCSLSSVDLRNRTAETNARLHPDAAGQGFGTETAYLLHMIGFDYLGLECIYTTYLADNSGSAGVVQKLGLVKEGVLRSRVYKAGKRHDLVSMSMKRIEFEELRKKYEEGNL